MVANQILSAIIIGAFFRVFSSFTMKKLNNRPRKRLGYKIPYQVFFGEKYDVALKS